MTLEEHGHPAILGIRLKVAARKISEMEALVVRSTARGSFSNVPGMKDRPILTEPLKPSERRSRDELITVANSYFEGMEIGTEHPVNTPFDEPFSFMIGELFKIKEGKIRQIEALVINVPYGMGPGWAK